MLQVLGTQKITFTFGADKDTTRTQREKFDRPEGTNSTLVWLSGFDVRYTKDDQNGYGRLGVQVQAEDSEATCTATLRDDTLDQREWRAEVTAVVVCLGGSQDE